MPLETAIADQASAPDPRPGEPPELARHERMPVGVFVERRKAVSAWADFVWRPVAVVAGSPALAPWTVACREGDTVRYFAGVFEMELFPRETANYRTNLSMPDPSVYVVVQSDATAPQGLALRFVTVSPSEAEAYMDGAHIVERVPMPEAVGLWLADYVAAYHVEEKFQKRKRKPHDPRKGFGRDSGHNDYGPSTD